MTVAPPQPKRRLVLLGASNLTRAMGTVVDITGGMWNEPRDILFALGNGRSYGMWSNLLGRGLPSILHCGIWDALERRPSLPTTALVTDIGNDILYHAPVVQIAEWIERCLDRLRRAGARTVITGLPVCNLARLSRRRFLFFRTLFMPFCRLSLAEVVDRTHQLNERIERMAGERGVLVIQQEHWYGSDPIHIRMRQWGPAWRQILAPWTDDATAFSNGSKRLVVGLRLHLLSPAERTLFGARLHRSQPCARWPDGTTISIY
ncbi:MAG TPA: SGNH/GDSL hydrolase family protein [Pirellulales bacterium]|jgi:hypothetical protein|nr:SGNH/GDSL hydrolase family protein [Pirellulales bacterium]